MRAVHNFLVCVEGILSWATSDLHAGWPGEDLEVGVLQHQWNHTRAFLRADVGHVRSLHRAGKDKHSFLHVGGAEGVGVATDEADLAVIDASGLTRYLVAFLRLGVSIEIFSGSKFSISEF